MTKVEKIKLFNEILENLLLQLSPKIGSGYHFWFLKYLKVNAVTPINNFWFFAESLENKILNRDETYFTNPDNHVDKVKESKQDNALDEIIRLKGIWEKLSDESKDNVWDMTQAMLIIAMEYLELKK